MKIIYKKGNLVEAPEKYIAHGCNAQGVMGSGVAKAIREVFPEAYRVYNSVYVREGLKLGAVIRAETNGKEILNCITQKYFGRSGKLFADYDAIRECMAKINFWAGHDFDPAARGEYDCSAIAMPKIGAGLGGGDWNIISKIIEDECANVQPVVYEL